VTHFAANPKPGGYAPDYMMTSSGLLNLASPPLSGSVTVDFGAYCDEVELGVAESAYGLANKLNSLPGIKGGHLLLYNLPSFVIFFVLLEECYNRTLMA
jgi:hypothetical protein